MTATDQRRIAKVRLDGTATVLHSSRSNVDTLQLVHELEVHQIELEIQNTELRQARNDLETVLNKYTELYDFAPVGYITLDCRGNIVSVNLAGASLIGGVRSQLLGRPFKSFTAPEDRIAFCTFLDAVLKSKIKSSCEVTIQSKKGQPVIVQIDAMSTASGLEFRLILIDITRRRSAEDALDRKQQELIELNQLQAARITKDVEVLRNKDQMLILQERQAVMGEMFNNIAHQWRQPLNTLGLIIQQLPLFYGSTEFDKAFLDDTTDNCMKLIQHMSQTINDFRNFFRSDKEMTTFNVNRIIKQTVNLIEKGFEYEHIDICLHQDSDPTITGYPNEYAQVLLNILMNSRDAFQKHHVVDALISINTFSEGDISVVTVTDNAGGINEDIIEKIFDPYFTTKEPDKGTGIGLFMSKSIIEKNMGGKLTARNAENGAEFRIDI
jgi:PAS domain S-box-containing protein